MSRFSALIMMAAVALFIAGPAMAQETNPNLTVTKSVDNSNTANTAFNTDVNVTKDVNIGVSGDLEATGGVNVSGDSIFKEMDVNVQDQENVVKFFELDDSAKSSWTINAQGAVNALEQLQNGAGNWAEVHQKTFTSDQCMNVGLQYQVGDFNTTTIAQTSLFGTPVNNFAKQIQIGEGNNAAVNQNQ